MSKIKTMLSLLFCSLICYSESIDSVRTICNELTNESITSIAGYRITKRKDLLVNHVRRVCEELESAYDESRFNDDSSTGQILELKYIRNSWIQKFEFDQGLGFFDILMMGASHQFSPWLLRYELSDRDLEIPAVSDSPYWTKPHGPRALEFERKAAIKNIRPTFKWALLEELEVKGSAAKSHIKDLSYGERWLIKWGDEVHTDPVGARLFSALGFNTDHPYFVGQGAINVILGKTPNKKKRTISHFVKFIYNAYAVNLSPFIFDSGKIDQNIIAKFPELAPFKGQHFISFKSAAIEARPKSELRLGGMLSGHPEYQHSPELRGAILAHLWIGNWDIKEMNTLLSISQNENAQTSLRGSFSDLGISLGVKVNKFPRDVKAGLVNELSWDLVSIENNQIRFNSHVNAILKTYSSASFSDLYWMATQISQIDEGTLRSCLSYSGWPTYVRELYFYKLSERRRQILEVFKISDPYPVSINRWHSHQENNHWLVKDGELVVEPDLNLYPQGLLHFSGRFRGFGW